MSGAPLTIRELLAAYRDGSLDPDAVVARAHERARAAGAPAWISVVPWETVSGWLASLSSDLPLYGVPFAVKDNIHVAGVPTTAACPRFSVVPPESAVVIDLLLSAGAIPIGKTNMDQFATGLAGTRSPYGSCSSVFDSAYVSGGSSSGSAVVVADGTVPFSLGTDTAGSGRVPAALNGIVGLKPSRGLVSVRGTVPACASLDCVSVFALDVADASLILDVVAEVLPSGPSRCPRIGLPAAPTFADDESAEAWGTALARFAGVGWETAEFDFAPLAEAGGMLYDGPWVSERYAAVGSFIEAHRAEVDPIVADIVLGGARFTAAEAFTAQYRLAELRARVDELWQSFDSLVVPTVPGAVTHAQVAAAPRETVEMLGTYTNFANLLDMCAVAVPAGWRADGLPFGVTLLGPAGADRRLLELAGQLGAPGALPRHELVK